MNRRPFFLALVAAAVTGFTYHLNFRNEARRKSLLIAGSTTMLALNNALKAFCKLHPQVDVVVEKGGSLPGLIALKRGAIDIAAMDRDLQVAEDDLRTHNYLIAKSNVTIVVNKKLPITSLTTKQIRALFSGAASNWREVGGPDAPVHLISRTNGSTARQFIEQYVLEGDDFATAKETETARLLLEQVAQDPYSIGYLALRDHFNLADAAEGIAYLAVNGVTATRATVLSERYPYTHSLYLVLYGEKSEQAADFIAFARSAVGQKIVEQQYLVPVA